MTHIDREWFRKCHAAGLVNGRMLEVGSAKIAKASNLCEIARELGVTDTLGVDIERTDGVDVVFDFDLPPGEFKTQWSHGKFATVCIFNVLEHTYDPITILTNALSCVERSGTLLVLVPSVWPIHNYPGDYNRLLPDWYVEFARRNGLVLLEKHFCWLSEFGIQTIDSDSRTAFPTYRSRYTKTSAPRYWISRAAHKVLNTYGRSHWANHSAIAAAFSVQ
ncbi:MAG TPA: methyltransferase domain-containing protein [Bryobacteraceae bacterium]|jgi:hypothetical protein|nr:methyltransferase domain-containing protein [Bryobacteraceae bacterium]